MADSFSCWLASSAELRAGGSAGSAACEGSLPGIDSPSASGVRGDSRADTGPVASSAACRQVHMRCRNLAHESFYWVAALAACEGSPPGIDSPSPSGVLKDSRAETGPVASSAACRPFCMRCTDLGHVSSCLGAGLAACEGSLPGIDFPSASGVLGDFPAETRPIVSSAAGTWCVSRMQACELFYVAMGAWAGVSRELTVLQPASFWGTHRY